MIGVGNCGLMYGLNLEFGVVGDRSKMKEIELEQGEAGFYHDGHDHTNINLDLSLAHIVEKLHNLLGHFQKDFDGEVSAETLGAKFGGYGTFLPTYQRYPGESYPDTSPEVHGNDALVSPKSSQLEGGYHNSGFCTSELLVRHEHEPRKNVALSATMAPYFHDSGKQYECGTDAEEFNPLLEMEKTSAKPRQKNPLKFRIKVGSDNLSTENIAAIYSGLGLDFSPSSSQEDSPLESKEMSRSPQGAPDDSPYTMIQMMTSFPAHEGLLSPLLNDLICLTKEDTLLSYNKHPLEEKKSNSMGRTAANSEVISPMKLQTDQKAISKENNNVRQLARKKNSKGRKIHNAPAAEISKRHLASNIKKVPPAENSLTKIGSANPILLKGFEKSRDVCNEVFGDNSLDLEEEKVSSLEISSNGTVKSEVNEKLSEKRATNAYLEEIFNSVPESAPLTVAPVESNDNWVCCDKCQKWRLLPIATNPESLPDKWLCSMLNWLSGMNRCSFSEEETTNAVHALNQASQSVSQINLQIPMDGNVSEVAPSGMCYPDQNNKHLSFTTVPIRAKKTHKPKEVPDTTNQDDSAWFPGFKNIQPSVETRSLNEFHQSSCVSEPGFQKFRKCDSVVGKNRNIKKEKYNRTDNGVNANNSMLESKRKNDQDDFRHSKKTRKEGMQYTDDNWMHERGGITRKAAPSSSSGLPTDAVQSNFKQHASSNESNCDGNKNSKASRQSMKHGQVSLKVSSQKLKKCDNLVIAPKKRKFKECEESCENDHRNQKKPRLPKYDGMNSNTGHPFGFCKIKTNFGSSVESVSSLHSRIPKVKRLATGRMNPVEKKDLQNTSKKENSFNVSRLGSHESSELDFQAADQVYDVGRINKNNYYASRESGKDTFLKSNDKNQNSKSEYDEHKNSDSSIVSQDHTLPHDKKNGGDSDKSDHLQRQLPVSFNENGVGILSAGICEADDALKGPKQTRKAENKNGSQRYAPPNVRRIRDLDALGSIGKDHSSQAATNAVKEATDLKHLADRLKNSVSNHESTGLYLQAALKFLHGASLLESYNSESSKHVDQSMQIYSSTAKLCEFCAHGYERSKDMAGAALAYKCMEVAYMRVVYASHSRAIKDQHDLHTATIMAPPGESPSSCASDVDSLNYVVTVDKVIGVKSVFSPRVAGSHIITDKNRPSFVWILNYTRDVNFAMEASRKSRLAFGAAKVGMEGAQHKEHISSIKSALDLNFHDVEGLIHLVRIAMEVSVH